MGWFDATPTVRLAVIIRFVAILLHNLILTFFQHLAEELPLELSALDYMQREFPDVREKEEMRKIIGRYGLTGREQVFECHIYIYLLALIFMTS